MTYDHRYTKLKHLNINFDECLELNYFASFIVSLLTFIVGIQGITESCVAALSPQVLRW
jgi:hypothetical protein